MNGIWSRSSGVAVLLALASAHATAAEVTRSSKVLETMEYQPLIAGEIWQLRDEKGNSVELKMTEVSDGMVTVMRSDGCIWTRVEDGFPPSAEWRDCSGSSGTHEVTREGNIYPLSVGAKETWVYRGKYSKGNQWKGKRSCEVTEVVAVTVPAGGFDAFHVRCKDPDWDRHFYAAPELQRIVYFWRKHRRDGRKESSELVALIKP